MVTPKRECRGKDVYFKERISARKASTSRKRLSDTQIVASRLSE